MHTDIYICSFGRFDIYQKKPHGLYFVFDGNMLVYTSNRLSSCRKWVDRQCEKDYRYN